jgi:hypothetical protein
VRAVRLPITSSPKLYSFLLFCPHEADGITWEGQPIPGLAAEDASYLAKLTGAG